MEEIRGRCSCGQVQFMFNTDALTAYQCHCSICRKATGSAYSTTLLAPEDGFAWIDGKDKVSIYARDNGYRAGFCSLCGSPVPNKFRDFSLVSVPLGSLDKEPEVEIVVQIYLDSKAKWEKDGLQGRRYAEMPSLDEMFELLHLHPSSLSFESEKEV